MTITVREAYLRGVRDGMTAAARTVARMAIREAEADDGDPDLAEALDVISLAIIDTADTAR